MKTLQIAFSIFSFLLMTSSAFATTLKEARRVTETDQVIREYNPYLKFVLEIGQGTSHALSKKMEKNFSQLLATNPQLAADFLRGLQFEIEQKRQIMGASETFSTQNTSVRQWVTRFIPIWEQESEEYVFRADTASLSKK